MDLSYLKWLLGIATLLPLVSFWVILVAGPWLGKQAWLIATGAIGSAGILSFLALFGVWLPNHWPQAEHHDDAAHVAADHVGRASQPVSDGLGRPSYVAYVEHDSQDAHGGHATTPNAHHAKPPQSYTGYYYLLGQFGKLRLEIGYYIDALTICMFCMVTLIATCIHVYAGGYMHDELHDVDDHEVHTHDGHHLHRPGRFPRFFQYMSLFSFSMLGLVLAGNIAMVFVFWELVGICSYFLIGFYIERKSASTAANKAFIVNRVGDFGMIIGLMALWGGLGTFAFGDIDYDHDKTTPDERGIFSLVRSEANGYALQAPDGMVKFAARKEAANIVREHLDLYRNPDDAVLASESEIAARISTWRKEGYGYWLLIIAGVGIFCGCVGKSAQFPLHTWLPDAMEGPTPVSALVHSATMVAAGVYLVGRFYPVFTPEVLLVIASVGAITLFLAATIAITATDIKRVLAYSTISQLGYMMLALGLGGWVAGLMHLITHAFFKSLLFLCSGSVIHAVHTNDMTKMGGLRKKMPITAYTMLVGCLAIAGAGIPFVIGLSGYYSKDAILEQAYSFMFTQRNALLGTLFFSVAAGGAAITAFYMFRLWFMTFAGEPRDHHKYDHARESPKTMYVPLIILAFFAITVAWPLPNLNLANLLGQARPAGTNVDATGVLVNMTWPAELKSHVNAIRIPVTLLAFGTAVGGIILAAAFYGLKYLDPEDARRQFGPIYKLLWNKWYFDELYDFLFVRPTLAIGRIAAAFDRNYIDWIIDGTARVTKWFASIFEWVADQTIVDGFVNLFAAWMYSLGLTLRQAQTGRLRQYVMFIVVAAIAIFLLISFFWNSSLAR